MKGADFKYVILMCYYVTRNLNDLLKEFSMTGQAYAE